MITGVQPKLLVSFDESGNLQLDPFQAELMDMVEKEYKWELVRERDGLTKQSEDVMWVEWNEDGRFKERHDKPAVGRSLIMSPFNDFFTWQCTSLTEIIEQKEDYLKFKTQNSNYELFRLSQDVE